MAGLTQTRLTRPEVKVDGDRMAPDQRETVRILRAYGCDFSVQWFRIHTGYKDPGGAIRRLARRGFVRRVGYDRYRMVRIGERRV